MRRFIALILILIVPLQFTWSAAAGLHGHVGKDVVVAGFHIHDHHDLGQATHESTLSGKLDNSPMGTGHDDNGHHDGHCHHVLSLILPGTGLIPGQTQADGPIPRPPVAFLTRTPSLLDRPPLAFA